MAHEGMVHALEEIYRLLEPGGVLIDIHPVPEGSLIKAIKGEEILFAERKRETCSEDVQKAENAITEIIQRGLFQIEQSAEFDYLTYASSVTELRDHWNTINAFDDAPPDETTIAREEYLFTKVADLIEASGPGVEAAIHEVARITRLRRVIGSVMI